MQTQILRLNHMHGRFCSISGLKNHSLKLVDIFFLGTNKLRTHSTNINDDNENGKDIDDESANETGDDMIGHTNDDENSSIYVNCMASTAAMAAAGSSKYIDKIHKSRVTNGGAVRAFTDDSEGGDDTDDDTLCDSFYSGTTH